MTYTFGDVTKTLKRNTFYLEKRVKEEAGLTDSDEKRIEGYKIRLEQLSKQYDNEKDKKKKSDILKKIEEVAEQIKREADNIWYNDPERCKKVLDVLLIEGSKDLTEENFSSFDAQEVFADFFTHPRLRGKS